MIALVVTFRGFGLLGLVAYGALIVVGRMIIAPFYWGYRLARFILRLEVVLAHAAVAIAGEVFWFVRAVLRLTWRAVRFTILAAVHVGQATFSSR